jgi:predicted membrane protein
MYGPIASVLWLLFAALWIFQSSALLGLYHWIQSLNTVFEVIVWIILLPWVFSLWIWQTSLALWLKILIIFVIAILTIGGSTGASRSRSKRRRI